MNIAIIHNTQDILALVTMASACNRLGNLKFYVEGKDFPFEAIEIMFPRATFGGEFTELDAVMHDLLMSSGERMVKHLPRKGPSEDSSVPLIILAELGIHANTLPMAADYHVGIPSSESIPGFSPLWEKIASIYSPAQVSKNAETLKTLVSPAISLAPSPFHFTHLHQVWLSNNPVTSGDIAPSNIPFRYDGYRKAWQTLNPDMIYKLWHEPDVVELIKTHYPLSPEVLDTFMTIKPHICRCDFARALIVHALGGLYIDADFSPVKPVYAWNLLHEPSGFVIFSELSEHSAEFRTINGVFGAENPGHPFLEEIIKRIVDKKDDFDGDVGKVMALSGPKLWAECHQDRFRDIVVQDGYHVTPYSDAHEVSKDFKVEQGSAWCFTLWSEGSNWAGASECDGKRHKFGEIEMGNSENSEMIWITLFGVACGILISMVWMYLLAKQIPPRQSIRQRAQSLRR